MFREFDLIYFRYFYSVKFPPRPFLLLYGEVLTQYLTCTRQPVSEYDAHIFHATKNRISHMQLTVVNIVAIVMLTKCNPRNITPCSPVKFNGSFGGTYLLHPQGRIKDTEEINMEQAASRASSSRTCECNDEFEALTAVICNVLAMSISALCLDYVDGSMVRLWRSFVVAKIIGLQP
jgi:hypothetical protein